MILNEQSYNALSHGKVIEAVDNALRVLDIQSPTLREFMIRIARTESGGNPDGLAKITHHTADPFQLDSPATIEVKTNINMGRWRDFFDRQRDEGVVNMGSLIAQEHGEIESNEKLGAIFATLYVIWRMRAWDPTTRSDIDASVPKGLNLQAEWWKKYYNTSSGAGKVQDFIDKNS